MFKKAIYILGMMSLVVTSLSTTVSANELDIKKDIDVGEQVREEGNRASVLYSNGNSDKSLFIEMMNESELKRNKVNVCILDDYKNEYTYDDSDDVFYHGDIVEGFLNKYLFKDNAINIDKFESDSNNIFYGEYDKKMNDCDILNVSMSFFLEDETVSDTLKEQYIKVLNNSLDGFLTSSNAFVVASAGNNATNATEQTLFATMREGNVDSTNKNNYLIVGQIEKNNGFDNSFAYGKSVDLMVANKWEILGNYKYTGTSYASPVVSAIAANLYMAGFDYKEIHELLTSSSTTYKDAYTSYPVLNENEVYKKAIEKLSTKKKALVEAELNKENKNKSNEFKLFKAFSDIHQKSFKLNL